MAQLMTTKQVGELLGCSPKHVGRLRADGLKSIRLGQLVRYRPEDVDEYIRKHTEGAA